MLSCSARIPFAALLACVLPLSLHAGGGGGGTKTTLQVRIKNITEVASAQSESAPLVSILTVAVGDGGNAATNVNVSSTATPEMLELGSVSSSFRIAKNEVTVGQYTAFLNAVASVFTSSNRSVVNSLYNRAAMGAPRNVSGISRQGRGTVRSPFVYETIGNREHPMANVTWFNAARFANWMHNGATNGADTETGAYTLNRQTRNGDGIARNPDAKWWIPNENEWFKTAHYKGGSANAGYYSFPPKSDVVPGNSDPAATTQANFRRSDGTFCVTQTNTFDRGQNYLTPVGFFTNSPGPYGTFDQAGNVQEWIETEVVRRRRSERVLRGASWNSGLSESRPRDTASASFSRNTIGFRLASEATVGSPSPSLTGNVFLSLAVNSANRRIVAPQEVSAIGIRQGQFTVFAEAQTTDPAAQGPLTNGTFTVDSGDTSSRVMRVTVKVISDSITVSTNAPGDEF
jgi:formylglycine-generating enzyme required for sulfatase activity